MLLHLLQLIALQNYKRKKFTKLLKLFYKITPIDLNKIIFNKEIGQYEYRNQDLVITFDKLSKCFNDKELIKELTSNKRYHKCHIRAISISPNIKNSRIVTGYITIGNTKVLHSVIEYEYNNETIVLDWTRNSKIKKEQYIDLTNFVELASFEGKKVVDDIKIFRNLHVGVKPYVLFRDELVKDMQRNSQIFKLTEQGKKDTQAFRNDEKQEEVKKSK